MIILGIHQGHDSSAAIIEDGRIVADVAEERFTRLKHCNHIPAGAINYCLNAAGLGNINDVDYVAFSWKTPGVPLQIALGIYDPQKHNTAFKRAVKAGLAAFGYAGYGMDMRKPPIYFPDFRLEDRNKFVPVEHHLAHAASAYYTGPTADKCLIFTVDGAGDEVSTAVCTV